MFDPTQKGLDFIGIDAELIKRNCNRNLCACWLLKANAIANIGQHSGNRLFYIARERCHDLMLRVLLNDPEEQGAEAERTRRHLMMASVLALLLLMQTTKTV